VTLLDWTLFDVLQRQPAMRRPLAAAHERPAEASGHPGTQIGTAAGCARVTLVQAEVEYSDSHEERPKSWVNMGVIFFLQGKQMGGGVPLRKSVPGYYWLIACSIEIAVLFVLVPYTNRFFLSTTTSETQTKLHALLLLDSGVS